MHCHPNGTEVCQALSNSIKILIPLAQIVWRNWDVNITHRICSNHQEIVILGYFCDVTKESALREAAAFSCKMRFLDDD